MDNFIFSGSVNNVTDKRYIDYYNFLKDTMGFKLNESFFIALVLGYSNSRKTEDFISGGIEFRPSYFNGDQQNIIYAIAYDIYGEDLFKRWPDKEFQNLFRLELNKYANGGMEILKESYFKDKELNGKLNIAYTGYDLDLLRFIYDQINSVPF
ncbi:hypothetical protein [uncultured Anaerococcus sp.]|uniref:hypothetical protein n=1 Tax=uncultured Anaerococcus sp. TaxID=293428 RepID=UPI002615CA9B|nr:hypothetical protein [uncultured Anaerococcus sp.]